MTENYIIAVDGPAASGKSTIAKRVAKILGINYIDSGAMFRAITLYMLDNNIDCQDSEEVIGNLNAINLDIEDKKLLLNGQDIEEAIRENRINQNVSYIAVIKEVRELLLDFQRKIAKDTSIIMDGRDIGSKVFPQAEYKFYLTASPEERAERRYKELIRRGNKEIEYSQVLEEIRERDTIDSTREHSPLIKAEDAIEIDTTDKSIEEIVDIIVSTIEEA